jgi:hypothetical protein
MSFKARAALSVLAAALLSGAAHADDNDDAQVWLAMSTNTSIKGPLELHADINTRHSDNARHLGHVQLRGLLGWRFSRELMLGAGYSYVRTEALDGRVAHEHRIFQQLNFPIAGLGNARLVGRTRFEQRLFEERDGVALRLRQQIRLNIPVDGAPKGTRVILYTEPFFLLNEPVPGASAGLNQVRSFAGLGTPLIKGVTLEVGYLNQAITMGPKPLNHALSVSLGTSF